MASAAQAAANKENAQRLRTLTEETKASLQTRAVKHGLTAKLYSNTVLQGELIGLGARFVIAGTDTNYVLAGARQDTAALRAIKIG